MKESRLMKKGAPILVDTKNLLKILYPAVQRMPKADRMQVGDELKAAAHRMISDFCVAYQCPEVRLEYIHKLIGNYACIQADFEIAVSEGLFKDRERLDIAETMERIEEGIGRWHNALATQHQAQRE